MKRTTQIFCAISLLMVSLGGFNRTAQAALDNGVEPENLGKGDWIWQVPNAEANVGASSVQGLVNYEKSKGMRFVIVKGADGGQIWSQFTSDLVTRFHASGIKVFAFQYVYGSYYGSGQVAAEISAANYLMSITDSSGVPMDGFMIDAEIQYNGEPSDAITYCQGIRAVYPNRCLTHSPYPIPSYNTSFPYIEFGRYCDVVMPQDYWYDQFEGNGGVTPQYMADLMNSDWVYWQGVWQGEGDGSSVKPLAPIGQGFQGDSPIAIPGSQLTDFMLCLKTNTPCPTVGGIRGISFWVCDEHSSDHWNALQSINIGNPYRVDSYAGNDNNGNAQIFLPDAVNNMASDWQNTINGSWVGWSSFGGLTVGGTPAVGYNADGRMQLFVRDTNGTVWSIWKTTINGSWNTWQNFGGNIVGELTVGYLPSGAMQIFGRSPSNTVQTINQTGANAGWTSWSDLGGSCYSDPVVAPNADGRMQIFCRNSGNIIQSEWKSGLNENSAWSGWYTFSISVYGKPCVGLLADGTMQVFCRSGSNTVQTFAQTGPNAAFGSTSDLGGSCYSDPVLAYGANGTFHLFICTSSNTVSLNAKMDNQGGAWSGWTNMGGNCAGYLTAGYNGDGRIQIYMRDTNYNVQSTWQTAVNSSTWNSWFNLGGNTPVVNITSPPTNQTVNAGQNVTFTVVATNALTYQWAFNGSNISGATTTSYTMSNAQTTNAGNYNVIVANHAGTLTSTNAVLTVISAAPPSIIVPPLNRTVNQGHPTIFTVTAGGSPTLFYQWQLGGTNVAGATASTYVISSAQPSQAGNYWVIVTNNYGSVTSAVRTLTVISPPAITGQPQNQSVAPGSNATFTVTATGGNLSYQWLFNAGTIGGATASSYTVGGAQTNNAGNYSVVVTNTAGTVTSSNALLTVTPPQPPQFLSVTVLSNGLVQMVLSGQTGSSYAIDGSSNLANWNPLTNFLITNGTYQFTDTSATNNPAGFYRARLLP